MKLNRHFFTACLWSVLVLGMIFSKGALAAGQKPVESEKTESSAKAPDPKSPQGAVSLVLEGVAQELGGSKAAVQEIEVKETKVKELLQQKQGEVQKTKQEADKVIAEKQVIEKEILSKEQAAEIARQEAETLKKKAEETNDGAVEEKAKELEKESEKLKKEAEDEKEKLTEVEAKAKVLTETVEADQAVFESMKQELAELKKEKSAKRGWIDKLIWIGITISIGLLFFFLMQFVLHKFEQIISEKDAIRESEATLRLKTLIALFRWLGTLLICGFVTYIVLEHFGIDMTPLLAGAGVIGLAFGFGGQYLIRDLISGIFILLEGQYRIHDVVKLGEYAGVVEAINLRITTLRDLEGRVIIVPNGEIKTVVNFTKDYSRAVIEIGVAYKEDVDRVMDVLKEVGKEMREDAYFKRVILEDLEMLGVDKFADSQVTIKLRFKTLPIKQWEVGREYRRRVKNRFDELGIEIPFPHRTFYVGTGKDNEWLKQLSGTQGSESAPKQ